MSAFGFPGNQSHNPNKDIEITSPPTDGISSLCWSPQANHLVATSWDNQVRCWEVSGSGSSVPKAAVSHDQPVLCSAWSPDGTTVFSGMSSLYIYSPYRASAHDALFPKQSRLRLSSAALAVRVSDASQIKASLKCAGMHGLIGLQQVNFE